MKRTLLSITTGLCILACAVRSVHAQEVQTGIIVTSSGGTPLLLDGVESDKVPVHVASGTTVCTPGQRVYKSEGDRYIFQQWSGGSTDECIVPTRPGVYRAVYAHEVLLLIKSAAPGVQRSRWVTYAQPVELSTPATVPESEDTRYKFQGWSDGETPFELRNTIAPVKPTTIEVKWIREHRLQVDGPERVDLRGTGWYAEGTNLILRAPDILPGENDQERLKFSRWESTTFPATAIQSPQTATTTVNVAMPAGVRAVYDKQVLVYATSPMGTVKREFLTPGQEFVLETPPVVDLQPEQERLVFKRWEGMDGLSAPKITGKVDRPISLTAAYERQVMLKINAPHGVSGDGWQKAGSVAAVAVPRSVQQFGVLKSALIGFNGYPAGASTIDVLVNEPTVVTALYGTEPDWAILAVLLVLFGTLALIYVEVRYRWVTTQRQRIQHTVRQRRRRVTSSVDSAVPDDNPTELSIHRNGVRVPHTAAHQQH